jgi:hypothetical protein
MGAAVGLSEVNGNVDEYLRSQRPARCRSCRGTFGVPTPPNVPGLGPRKVSLGVGVGVGVGVSSAGIPYKIDLIAGGQWYTWRQLPYDYLTTMVFKQTTTSVTTSTGGKAT